MKQMKASIETRVEQDSINGRYLLAGDITHGSVAVVW